MPIIATEPKRLSDVLRYEQAFYSREEIVIASGAGVLEIGAVLGRVTASGKYVPIAPAASDGSQNAAALLIGKVDATAADQTSVAVVRHAVAVRNGLVFGGSLTTPQKDAAVAGLATLGIIVRQGA